MVADEKWIAKKQALPFASANGRERWTELPPAFQANLSCESCCCSFGWRDCFFRKKAFIYRGFLKLMGLISKSSMSSDVNQRGFRENASSGNLRRAINLNPPKPDLSSCLKNKGWYGLLCFLWGFHQDFPHFFRIWGIYLDATMASWGPRQGVWSQVICCFSTFGDLINPPKVAPIFWRNFGSLDFEIHPIFSQGAGFKISS